MSFYSSFILSFFSCFFLNYAFCSKLEYKTSSTYLSNILDFSNKNLKNIEFLLNNSAGFDSNIFYIDLSNNKIEEISLHQSILLKNKYPKLTTLNLENNLLKNADNLMYLDYLEELNLSGNKFKKIPENIGNLENLRKFYFKGKQDNHNSSLLTCFKKVNKDELFFPKSFRSLKNLEILDLGYNKRFFEIPEDLIYIFINLEQLNLNDTSLEFVPFELLSEMQKGRINFNFQNTPFEKYFESYLQ